MILPYAFCGVSPSQDHGIHVLHRYSCLHKKEFHQPPDHGVHIVDGQLEQLCCVPGMGDLLYQHGMACEMHGQYPLTSDRRLDVAQDTRRNAHFLYGLHDHSCVRRGCDAEHHVGRRGELDRVVSKERAQVSIPDHHDDHHGVHHDSRQSRDRSHPRGAVGQHSGDHHNRMVLGDKSHGELCQSSALEYRGVVNHSDAQLGSEDHRDEFGHKHAEEKCHEHHELIRDVDKLQCVHHHGSHVHEDQHGGHSQTHEKSHTEHVEQHGHGLPHDHNQHSGNHAQME